MECDANKRYFFDVLLSTFLIFDAHYVVGAAAEVPQFIWPFFDSRSLPPFHYIFFFIEREFSRGFFLSLSLFLSRLKGPFISRNN